MAEKEEKPQLSAEVMKANQGIAAQAALRAQQIMFRQKLNAVSISGDGTATKSATAALKKSAPPQVPVRGDSVLTKKPPEIPPKRNSLKKPIDGTDDSSAASKQPPPLPQKPGSAQNSPLPAPKLKDKPQIGMRPVPPTPQIPAKFDRPPANLPPQPATSAVATANTNALPSTNPFANLRNSPQLNQSRANNNSNPPSAIPPSGATPSKTVIPKPAKKPSISPIEDFGAEDALRGIESGLRNMERAMAEQMNLRSIEAAAAMAAQANEKRAAFNPIDFKRSIGGSVNSLDGSGNNIMTSSTTSSSSASGSTQNMSVIESMRLALNKNMRSMERGFSMEQMRMDQMHLNNSMRNFEANGAGGGGNGVAGIQRPFENHMKSLDRNLPLELQYSRHTRSHSQQETLMEQLRHHNLVNPLAAAAAAAQAAHSGGTNAGGGGVGGGGGGGLSRDDIRLRRRSSHDENQLAQAQAQNTNGGNRNQSLTNPISFRFCFVLLLFRFRANLILLLACINFFNFE